MKLDKNWVSWTLRTGLLILFLFACPLCLVDCQASPAAAACPAPKTAPDSILWDKWSLVKMAGDEIGWAHETMWEEEVDGAIRYRAESTMHMEMKRLGQSIVISMEIEMLEDAEGRILELHQVSHMSGQETLNDLVVDGLEAKMTITTMGKPREVTITWEENVLGSMGAWKLHKKMGSLPGTKYSFKTFSFDFSKVFTANTEVMGKEETDLLDGEKGTFLRTVNSADVLPGVKSDEFYDDDFRLAKTSTKMMGISMESYHCSEERAKENKGGELKSDMILETMAKANVTLPSPYKLDSILYRFEAKDTELGLPKGLADNRQEILEEGDNFAIVRISAIAPDKSQKLPIENAPLELEEYLTANAYLQCDHEGLIEKAHEVIGDETDAWKAACLLEHFVYVYIKDKNFGTGFASAAEVFENPTGDCSEHGVLLAAMCRAVGIPARVAVGYMYLGGIFGGHMWAEVWINGEWYPIDGVMGIGRVDPTHIRFSTASLRDGGLSEAFTAAITGLGNLKLTILSFTRGDKTVTVGKEFQDYVIEGDTYTNTLYGISVTKPEGCEFDDYDRDMSGINFTLVEIDGDMDGKLDALPAAFSFTYESLLEMFEAQGQEVQSDLKRKVCGIEGRVYMLEQKSDEIVRVLAVIHGDVCFLLALEIKDDEADIMAFEKMVKSIKFLD